MAINQFTEPDINQFFNDLNQAIVLNNKASFVGKGYMNIMFTNMNNSSAPALIAGSSWEQNGVLFSANTEIAVSGTPVNNTINYIYANTNNTLSYSTTAPAWNAVKGGWYSGNNRALAKFYYASSGTIYGNKVLIDRFVVENINPNYSPPSSGGHLIAQGTINKASIILATGYYILELKGGTGGAGGNYVNNGVIYYYGGAGVGGQVIKENIYIDSPETIYYIVGRNGANGGNSIVSYNYSSGGGGGGSGETSIVFIPKIYKTIIAYGGSGGGGCLGPGDGNSNAAGGGGGGGYGTASNSLNTPPGGYGGSNFVGGNAGATDEGKGGTVSNSSDSSHNGGNGKSNPSKLGGTGGMGVRLDIQPIINDYNIKRCYTGGGGGAATFEVNGANGGGITNTTSGYISIYRVG